MNNICKRESYIKNHNSELYEKISALPGRTWSEKIYMYEHGLSEIPSCPICGNIVTFENHYNGYRIYCSRKCMNSDPQKKDKVKKTCIEKYGGPNPLSSQIIKDKIKKTCIEKYGEDNPMKSNEIKQKFEQVSVEKMRITKHNKHIYDIPDLISYTEDGGWICRCPHSETCNQCKEKIYIIPIENHPSTIYWNRLRRGAELCTRLLPIQPLFSSCELQVRSWLGDLKIEYISNDRNLINPLELDIYIPSHKLAIEVNGSYWHSIDCKPKDYHYNKWAQCKENDVKMIILWEDWIHDHPSDCLQLLKYHLGTIKEQPYFDWVDNNLVDLGLGHGKIKEHLSQHDGFDCQDCGIYV